MLFRDVLAMFFDCFAVTCVIQVLPSLTFDFCCISTLRWSSSGMDLVMKIEGVGSPSGTPKKQVKIVKSGDLSQAGSTSPL